MSYLTRNVNVSKGQKDKIRRAINHKEYQIIIRLDYKDLVDGDDVIAFTKTQIKAIDKAIKNRKGVTILMSSAQLNANMKIERGFLGALLGLATRFLPRIAKTVLPALGAGAFSGLASSGVQKVMVMGCT